MSTVSLSRSSNPEPRASAPYYNTDTQSLHYKRQGYNNGIILYLICRKKPSKTFTVILTGTLRDLGGPGGPGRPGGPGKPTPGSPCRERM